METTKEYLLRNIAPPMAVMLVCLLGSFIIYQQYYKGPNPGDFALIQPAAGNARFVREHENLFIPADYRHIPAWPGGVAE